MQPVTVSVVGAGRLEGAEEALAEEVGGELARAGAILVCGGLGGVMEAACRGARAAGGTTVGILPGPDRRAANPYVDVAIATGLGEARNAIVARAGDAVIAVGGEYGTLSEVALALKLGTPVVGLGTWELRRDGRVDPGVVSAESPSEAVSLALEAARGTEGR